MNDQTENVLEAKLYEAVDQFAALSGIAGVRSDEAGVVQTAGDDASSAIAASDGAQSPSSVIMSGVTSTAPKSEALPSDDGSSTAPPVAGLSGNSARSVT